MYYILLNLLILKTMLAAACRVHVKLARLPAWFAKRASGALQNLPTIIFPNFTFSIFKNVPRASQFNSKLKASLTWRDTGGPGRRERREVQ